MTDVVQASPLGKASEYICEYQPDLLFPIPRQGKREEIGIAEDSLPFKGRDLWFGYELSWLGARGKPEVRIAQFELPCESPCLIESKSFKLYLNSYNQTCFDNEAQVQDTLTRDLSAAAGAPVRVKLWTISEFEQHGFQSAPGVNIDNLDIKVDNYSYAPEVLAPAGGRTTETINSHLLKSNCLVTGQPDWGSLVISYTGEAIDHATLLKYICSFRQHQEFHEQCVERVFADLQKTFDLEELTVYAQYVRRGGLDINPWRSTTNELPEVLRFIRQ